MPSVFILEYGCAFDAIKFCVVKLVKSKSINVFCEAQGLSTVRASVVFLLPHGYAGRAAELIAFIALLGLLNHQQADGAGEVLVKTLGGLL